MAPDRKIFEGTLVDILPDLSDADEAVISPPSAARYGLIIDVGGSPAAVTVHSPVDENARGKTVRFEQELYELDAPGRLFLSREALYVEGERVLDQPVVYRQRRETAWRLEHDGPCWR